MLHVPSDPRRLLLAGGAVGLAAVIGWGSFAYVLVTSSHRIRTVSTERDSAVAERQLLIDKAGQLAEMEAKTASVSAEYGRALQALAEVKAKMAVAQQELALRARRVDSQTDRVSQTGSIRPPEPPKRPAR